MRRQKKGGGGNLEHSCQQHKQQQTQRQHARLRASKASKPSNSRSDAAAGARDAGAHLRRLALYDQHMAHQPLWQPLGYWKRPRAYPKADESLAEAALPLTKSAVTEKAIAS